MMGAYQHRISAEEIANSVTHGIGLLLSIVGFAALLILAVIHGGAWRIVSCAVYGSTLVCLYTASMLYHGIQSPRAKRVLKVFDHCAIYLLIAGTYTPFVLVNLRGGWGWTLFGLVWGLATAGIFLKVWFIEDFKVLSTMLYLAMGWIVLIAAKPLISRVPSGGLYWLAAGGAMYTLGVVFYACRKLPYSHAVWHVFVLAGSICHYVAVLLAVVLPARA